jgi:PBP superfamily domain
MIPILLLVSCAEPPLPEPLPTPEIVSVAVDPAVWPLKEALQVCSDADPDLVVAQQEISPTYQDWAAFDLFVRMGEPEELPPFAAPIGLEQIVVIVNKANSVRALRDVELEGIFSGHIIRWSDIGGTDQPIQVWVFPEGDAADSAFTPAVMGGKTITRDALLAPSAAAMLEAVSGDTNAIGFLPRSWLEDPVRALEIDPGTMQKLRLPVLALASDNPTGAVEKLLYCLQQGQGLAEVLRLYER